MKFQVRHPDSATASDPRLDHARQVLRAEAAALELVADRLGGSFLDAVDLIYRGLGRVAVTGTGKSADVGQKIAGTLNSLGTRAYVLDATKAVHGDLGMVHPHDVALVLSHSGESEEVVRLLGPLRRLAAAVIGRPAARTARTPVRPTSRSSTARSRKSARLGWPPAPAPRP
jgi:arabinose-5-phosphate isomerase